MALIVFSSPDARFGTTATSEGNLDERGIYTYILYRDERTISAEA
jgi:hypothetical protein